MNNIKDYLNKLKEFSFFRRSQKKNLVKKLELTKANYNYGVIINMIGDLFEVYCYAISDDATILASSLLLKEFNEYEMTLRYYEKLGNMMIEKDIDFLYNKCKNYSNL